MLSALHERSGAIVLIVVVQGHQFGPVLDAQQPQQLRRVTRVFGRDHGGLTEHFPQPRRRVAEITDGRGCERNHPSIVRGFADPSLLGWLGYAHC